MTVAPALSLAATGLSAVGSFEQGSAKAAGDEFNAQQAELASQYGQIKATQTGTIMQQNSTAAMSHVAAIRASVGADPRSPTTAAILSRQEAIGDETRTQAVANINAQVQSDQAAAQFYTQSAGSALFSGMLGGASGLLSGIAGAVKTP